MKFNKYNKISLLILAFICTFTSEAAVFNSAREFSLLTSQHVVASGDLNKDGIPDLVVGGDPLPDTSLIGRIYVMLGKGNGTFQSPMQYSVGQSDVDPFSAPYVNKIEVGDLNNDGNFDVVVAHNWVRDPIQTRSSTLATILFGNGDGTLEPSQGRLFFDGGAPSYVTSINISDINGDDLKDVIVASNPNTNTGKIWIMENLGGNIFFTHGPKLIGANIYSIAGAELNDDDLTDLAMVTHLGVVIGWGNGKIFPDVYEQRDENFFEYKMSVHDFNRDGRLDILAIPYNSQQFRIFYNSPNGFPQNPVVYQTDGSVRNMNVEDINNDGRSDLICNVDYNLQLYYGNGLGEFTLSDRIQLDRPVFGELFEDFNLDGKLDLGYAYGPHAIVFLNAPNTSRYYTDFDGDTRSDPTIYRPGTGTWWTLPSGNSAHRAVQFGVSTDKPVAGNYDGDNQADYAVYRDGVWYILQSSDSSLRVDFWGLSEDVPVQADYDNDGAMDLAVYRPSEGNWYIKRENGFEAFKLGIATDKPVPADYDGDGKTDLAVWRPETGVWYIRKSSDNQYLIQSFGLQEDRPVSADYDGDGRADIAVFRPKDGFWYILQSATGAVRYERFGLMNDIPVADDYDGDGKSDVAVFRRATGTWFILNSSNGSVSYRQWGGGEDTPSCAAN